jgi:predicted AlkP superfamily pyrophosphatase or phosphodiesterase
MQRTAVLNVVGLTPGCLGTSMPKLTAWTARGQQANIKPMLPAVTCSVQATYLTGQYPSEHGIVANGWYFRDECEVKFWRQSNALVQAPKIWEIARERDPTFTCANLFWWYNMYSSVDYAVTPRPLYPADGRKLPDIHTHPAAIRPKLQAELGPFPLFKFWGPATTIESSQWIANSAKWIETNASPTLSLVYLPHLDYCTQKIGSMPSSDLQEIDVVVGDLIEFYEARGVQPIILSEYGITPVSQPVHLNQRLRSAGFLQIRDELGLELLDAGASQAFAVADHQLAHIYINDPTVFEQVKTLLEKTPGVAKVLDEDGKQEHHLNHERSGELVVIAEPQAWFTYYYWLDDAKAPDFARTVDIHRKPGYDPVELFFDPQIRFPKLKIAKTLLKRRLGMRSLMDLTPLNANLVRGSHGHLPSSLNDCPMVITQRSERLQSASISAVEVCSLILSHLN